MLALDVVLAVVFLVDAVLATSPSAILVTRSMPESMRVGDTATLTWVVESTATRSAVVSMNDALWPSLGASRHRVHLRMDSGQRVLVRCQLTPSRRGRFPLGAVSVRITGPMRFAHRQSTRSVPDVIRVMPAYPSRDAVRRRVRLPRVADIGLRSIRRVGGGTEFDQLREYLSLIHI